MAILDERLSVIADKFRKGIEEVKAAVANQGQITPEVEAQLAKLEAAADELDAVNPDAPTA